MADETTLIGMLSGAEVKDEAPSPAPAPAPSPEPQAASPAPAAGTGDAAPAAQPAPSAPIEEKEVRGLYGAMMDEREKRQKLERELADIRSKTAAPVAPSFKDNPEAATQAALAQQRFDMSEEMALGSGMKQEEIDAAKTWGMERAKGNPGFAAEYLRARSPISWVVQQHRRDKIASDVGDDPDAYVRRRAAELGFVAPAEGQQPASAQAQASPAAAPSKPSTLRPSLASAPSAGGPGAVPTGGMTAVEALPFMSR